MRREDSEWPWVVRALFAMGAAICEYLEEAQPVRRCIPPICSSALDIAPGSNSAYRF
jgi:hypothetical protein